MLLHRLTLREIRLPLKEPFRISSGVVTERRILLLELEADDGTVGWGESVAGETPNYSAETIDTAWHAITEWLAPRLLGVELGDPRDVRALLDRGVRGHEMAKAAVEMGCWDVAARIEDEPLAALLGGTRTTIDVGISIGIQSSPDALVERAVAAKAAGYRRIKLKIAPGRDVDYVAAARDALGGDVALSIDANAAYSPADAEHLARLDEYGLVMIEQPFPAPDLVRHAALQRALRTAICLDESITGPDQAEAMIALDAGRIINIKPGRVGGFSAALRIHDLCVAADVPVWCGGMLESGIGRAHNVALASLPGFTLPGDLSPSARYWERDIVVPEWTMEDGRVGVPRDRPGIGVEVDRERIERLTQKSAELTAG